MNNCGKMTHMGTIDRGFPVRQMTPNSYNYFLHEIPFLNYYLSHFFTFITRFLQVTLLHAHHVEGP